MGSLSKMLLQAVVVIIVLALTLHLLKTKKYSALPSPGLAIPLIGHVYKLFTAGAQKDPVNFLWNLYKKYQRNGLMHLNSFTLNLVFVGDFETLKYLFNHPDVQLRFTKEGGMRNASVEERKVKSTEHFPGVILSEGKTWVEQRRFALRTLRDFGFGKQGMEELIQEEVDLFKALILKNGEESFDFINKLNLPILNALWRVTVGERFDYDDPKLLSIVHRLTEAFKRFGKPESVMVIAFPWINKINPKAFGRDETLSVNHDIQDMMAESIKQHQQTLDLEDPRDFTDSMLIEINKTTDKTSSFYGEVGIENLRNTLFDLFLAGSETTSTTLTWAALYMVRYPEVQKRVQAELDSVVGQNRHPSIADRPALPYVEAVIMEVQRYANIVPNGVQHVNSRDITVNGVTIPAHTMIQPLLTNLLKGDYWGDGTVFRPERFLDEDGALVKDDHLIPFSIGKRQCLGETLAKVELYLFFANLVHSFHFLPCVEGELPSEDYSPGVTLLPRTFQAKLVHRF